MASSLPPKESQSNRDWFAPAIVADGHVGQCLEHLLSDLAKKNTFVAALRKHLWEMSRSPERDSLTALKTDLREFDKTLSFRLGMLSPDREAPWFRPLLGEKFGPFQAVMLKDPVLARYDAERIDAVRSSIALAWTKGDVNLLYFKDGAKTLWHQLIQLNAYWWQVISLQLGEQNLRLDQLPDTLDPALDSRMLRAFLVNVRSEALTTRKLLDEIYARLLMACDSLWDKQRQKIVHAAANPYKRTAERVRAEFRERRQSAKSKPIISIAEMQALRFMGFSDLPDEATLKKRYHELARRMHPDSSGGTDEAFKLLTKAYENLNTRLTR